MSKHRLTPEQKAERAATLQALMKSASSMHESNAHEGWTPYVSRATGKPYSGYNQCLIEHQVQLRGLKPASRELLTFNQIRQEKLHLKKGSKSVIVVYSGKEPTGKVKIDPETEEKSIEQGKEFSQRIFRLFFFDDCVTREERQ